MSEKGKTVFNSFGKLMCLCVLAWNGMLIAPVWCASNPDKL